MFNVLCSFTLSLALGCSMTLAEELRQPNILLIVADDLGYSDTGFNGSKDIPTPQLDSIAAMGTICKTAYVTHAFCSPSRAAIMTGRYQQRYAHEINPKFGTQEGVALSELFLPQLLAQAGYQTGWIGKWHLGSTSGYLPQERGFAHSFGFYGGGHHLYRWKANPDKEYLVPLQRNGQDVEVKEHLSIAFGKEAAAFIKENENKPWFLYLAFNAPHTPNEPTPEKLAQMGHIESPVRRAYGAEVALMDDAIALVIEQLKESEQLENTIIFFLSDNGGRTVDIQGENIWHGADNGPLRAGKSTLFEGGIRVPFLVSWPAGKIPAGAVYEQPISSLDIFATAMALSGSKQQLEKALDGVNLVPHLLGLTRLTPHKTLFWRVNRQLAARSVDFKLLRDTRYDDQLFRLGEDIGETNDVACQYYEQLIELEDAADQWNTAVNAERATLESAPKLPRFPERRVPESGSSKK